MDDLAILRGCRVADEASAEALVRRYGHLITWLLRQAGVAESDVDDVRQIVLAEAILRLQHGDFDGRCALKTWLASLTRHKASDWLRRTRRDNRRCATLAGVDADPSPVRSNPELFLTLREAVMRLEQRERLAFLLFFVGGRRSTRSPRSSVSPPAGSETS